MPRHSGQRSVVALALAVAGCFGLLVHSPASAEVAEKGGVRVAVVGGMTPKKLPRSSPVPVAVSVAGRISATRSGSLPQLEQMAIAINSRGKLNTGGPVCRLGHIDPSTTSEALAACRPALIGEGSFSADVRLPEQSPFPSDGKVLAFNGRLRGKPAILAHIYGTAPVPTSYVLPFTISKTRGDYGVRLEASFPQVTGEWGYVTGIRLDLDRRFTSASCPAPAGYSGAIFPLMQTSFDFGGGLTLDPTLMRRCRVR
jgi:hypothetical protein